MRKYYDVLTGITAYEVEVDVAWAEFKEEYEKETNQKVTLDPKNCGILNLGEKK